MPRGSRADDPPAVILLLLACEAMQGNRKNELFQNQSDEAELKINVLGAWAA